MTIDPAAQTVLDAGRPAHTPAPHPARIGCYRILRVLGQGGMGTVYEAEQLEPLRRRVALKVVRHGLDTRGSSPASSPSARRSRSWTTPTSPRRWMQGPPR